MTTTYPPTIESQDTPWQTRQFWIISIVSLVALFIITMIKDYYLTDDMPNPAFYVVAPLLSLVFGTLVGYGIARLFDLPLTVIDVVALFFITEIIGQLYEIVTKLIYYLVVEYPSLLFLVGAVIVVFTAAVYTLVRWRHMKWWTATGLVVGFYLGQLILVSIALSILGISTPGS